MSYCSNCGRKVSDNTKFCAFCDTYDNSKRRVVYEGETHQCPQCGEVLDSFISHCPACRYEIRGAKSTSSVRELALKLEAIEAQRETQKRVGLFRVDQLYVVSKTDEQKISLIKNFPIPNTKEDILEFMILATSNIDMSMYSSLDTPKAGAKGVTEAWHTKIKQTYAKAKNTYKYDKDFAKIQELYDSCYADIKKQKNKQIVKWILLFSWIPLFIVIMIWAAVSTPKDEAAEIERLEEIVVEVQKAIDNGEYKHALRIADSIDYQRYDIATERKWDIEREYWVDKVLEIALENGVELEYTPTADIDNANK